MKWWLWLAFWLIGAGIIYNIIKMGRKEIERMNTKGKGGKRDELHRTIQKLNRVH
jgi:hypothetical protein